MYGNKEPCDLKDPGLTDLGVLQCATLCKTFPRMDKITHIISSPSRRAILTTKLSFRPLINRGVPLVLLNFLKERSQCPTNEGSPIEELQKEFGDLKIVYDHLERGWETDFMDYDQHGWRPITVEMRREIFMVGMEAMKKGQVNTEGNVEMLVTSHGGTLRYFDGAKSMLLLPDSKCLFEKRVLMISPEKHDGYHWNNTEHRAYEFFSEERAQKREISRWQGLRQCLSKDFNTSAIEQPLLVKELEDWGWKIAEIERINIFRNRSLLGYQKLRADRRKIKE